MRAIRFLPLVFVVGVEGFLLFVPYVVLVLSAALLIRRVREQQVGLVLSDASASRAPHAEALRLAPV